MYVLELSIDSIVTKDMDKEQKTKFRKSFHLLLCAFAFALFCSFCFIIEPWGIEPEVEEATVELTPENAYFIDNLDGTYDIYYNNCHCNCNSDI